MTNIAILASGAGTNANRIIEYFSDKNTVKVTVIITDNPNAGVLDVAAKAGIPSVILSKEQIAESGPLLCKLEKAGAEYVVLAGFLRMIPPEVVARFSGRMTNIHPSLLPAYGGKGMYGERVHQAVMAAGEKQSGITIHLVSEHYDRGQILAQYTVPITDTDTVSTLEAKIHVLEHSHYPQEIERLIMKRHENDRQ